MTQNAQKAPIPWFKVCNFMKVDFSNHFQSMLEIYMSVPQLGMVRMQFKSIHEGFDVALVDHGNSAEKEFHSVNSHYFKVESQLKCTSESG